MITDQHIFKRKHHYLKMMGEEIKHALTAGHISLEQAQHIGQEMKSQLLSPTHAEHFRMALNAFAQEFPYFKKTAQAIQQDCSELLQKISNAVIEPMMDSDMDRWADLLDEMEEITEDSISNWIRNLPKQTKTELFDRLLTVTA